MSPETKLILDNFGTFQYENRGPVEMKGKGIINTFWLLGEIEEEDPEDGSDDGREEGNVKRKRPSFIYVRLD